MSNRLSINMWRFFLICEGTLALVQIKCQVRGLTTVGVPSESYGNLLTSVLMNKHLHLILSRKMTEGDWDLDAVMKLMEEEINVREWAKVNPCHLPNNQWGIHPQKLSLCQMILDQFVHIVHIHILEVCIEQWLIWKQEADSEEDKEMFCMSEEILSPSKVVHSEGVTTAMEGTMSVSVLSQLRVA